MLLARTEIIDQHETSTAHKPKYAEEHPELHRTKSVPQMIPPAAALNARLCARRMSRRIIAEIAKSAVCDGVRVERL